MITVKHVDLQEWVKNVYCQTHRLSEYKMLTVKHVDLLEWVQKAYCKICRFT